VDYAILYISTNKEKKMYKLIIRNWDGSQTKIESENKFAFLINAKFYLKLDAVKSVIVVDRTGYVYFYKSKVEGAKNVTLHFEKVVA
jgi:hypothetical protein